MSPNWNRIECLSDSFDYNKDPLIDQFTRNWISFQVDFQAGWNDHWGGLQSKSIFCNSFAASLSLFWHNRQVFFEVRLFYLLYFEKCQISDEMCVSLMRGQVLTHRAHLRLSTDRIFFFNALDFVVSSQIPSRLAAVRGAGRVAAGSTPSRCAAGLHRRHCLGRRTPFSHLRLVQTQPSFAGW